MNIKEYSEQAKRTLPLLGSFLHDNYHMAFGIVTEAGEIADIFKRRLAYGKEVDLINLKEEIGDLMWYVSNIAEMNNISLEECLDINIAKLKTRYPHKFSEKEALNRNLTAERKVLEDIR